MLNTYYHTPDDIYKAYFLMPEDITDDKERDAYASILIFTKFNVTKTNSLFDRLKTEGILFLSDVVGECSNGEVYGWSL